MRLKLALSTTRTLLRHMGASESQQGQQPPSAADPVFSFQSPNARIHRVIPFRSFFVIPIGIPAFIIPIAVILRFPNRAER